jgi:hypothetical protein
VRKLDELLGLSFGEDAARLNLTDDGGLLLGDAAAAGREVPSSAPVASSFATSTMT